MENLHTDPQDPLYDHEEQRKKKQEFIQKEILDKRYDRIDFASYMYECKEDGTNIDNWKLEELMDIVQDFKDIHKPLPLEDENPQPDPSTEDHAPSEVDEVEPVIEQTRKEISELSYFKKSELKVKVFDGLIKKGGFLQFSFTSFKVTLDPLEYFVRRREEDFQTLRKYLVKMYPSQFIPPLIIPSCRKKEDEVLKKEKFFTKFLTNVIQLGID